MVTGVFGAQIEFAKVSWGKKDEKKGCEESDCTFSSIVNIHCASSSSQLEGVAKLEELWQGQGWADADTECVCVFGACFINLGLQEVFVCCSVVSVTTCCWAEQNKHDVGVFLGCWACCQLQYACIGKNNKTFPKVSTPFPRHLKGQINNEHKSSRQTFSNGMEQHQMLNPKWSSC